MVFSNGDENVFTIPAPFMFDSSEYSDNNYDIKVTLEEYDNGYIYTLSPNTDWLLSSDRVYPVMIDPTTCIDSSASITCRYNSEANPNSIYSGIKISDVKGNRFETYISFNNYPDNICIQKATFNLTLKANNNTSQEGISIYALNTNVPYIFWSTNNNCDNNKPSYTKSVGTCYIAPSTGTKGWAIDITSLSNSWLNYCKCHDRSLGIPQYGFKLTGFNGLNTLEAYDENSNVKPYVFIAYSLSSKYTLPYTPKRYENCGEIENLQNHMNCYAYALQMYCKDNEGGNLNPGEFGIPYNKDYSNYGELREEYSNYQTKYNIARLNYNTKPILLEYMDFIEERMKEDAKALNISIDYYWKREFIDIPFELPENYDESNERIIAMVVNGTEWGTLDYHYYVRNGNGTCPNGHSGNCSGWSHQNGEGGEVLNTEFNKVNFLCDKNIHIYAKSGNYSGSPEVRCYRITKNTDIYNSWYYYGHDKNSTGTVFYLGN